MKKRKLLTGCLVVLFFLLAGGIIFAIVRWNRPLGPSLQLPTQTDRRSELILDPQPESSAATPLEEPTLVPAQATEAAEAAKPAQPVKPLTPTPTLQPLCEGPQVMTILAIGSDYRGEGYLYGLADAIRVVRIDFTTPAVMVVDFPRDLWVEIPEVSSHGITHGKLNQAYFYGSSGMGYYDGPGEGPGLLARTLQLNFGMSVDHYLTINMLTLGRAVDAIGGVDITFDSWVDVTPAGKPSDPTLVFSPGKHHLNGEQAILLAQNRIPNTFQRARYQNMLISALREKLLSAAMLPRLPGLVSQFIKDTQTDLSPSDINKLVCIAQQVSSENTRIVSFPQEMFSAGSIYDTRREVYAFIYEADFDLIRWYLGQFSKGIWPEP